MSTSYDQIESLLRQKREALKEADIVADLAVRRGGFDDELERNHDKALDRVADLKVEADRWKRHREAEISTTEELASLEDLRDRLRGTVDPRADIPAPMGGDEPPGSGPRDPFAGTDYEAAWNAYAGGKVIRPEMNEILAVGLAGYDPRGDLISDDDTSAGFLRAPTQTVTGVLKDLDDNVFVRGRARKFSLPRARSLGVPRRTSKISTFAWGAELSEPTKDSSYRIGGRELTPHYCTGELQVSRDFIRSSVIPPIQIVREELATESREFEEIAFWTGHGGGRPLGLMIASPDGVSTARDTRAASASAIVFEDVKDCKHDMRAEYWGQIETVTSRTVYKELAKLRAGGSVATDGPFLWEDSLKVGDPDRLVGTPVFLSESGGFPSVITNDAYVLIMGVFSNYWIVDALDFQLQRLQELEARRNIDAFLVRRKLDGAPVKEEAFRRLQMAA